MLCGWLTKSDGADVNGGENDEDAIDPLFTASVAIEGDTGIADDWVGVRCRKGDSWFYKNRSQELNLSIIVLFLSL